MDLTIVVSTATVSVASLGVVYIWVSHRYPKPQKADIPIPTVFGQSQQLEPVEEPAPNPQEPTTAKQRYGLGKGGTFQAAVGFRRG